jgi:tetratricopeptide (TPR) repeat protein
MNTAPSIQISVDTITTLTKLVALHGVYALVIIFMFYFEYRARKNIRTASTPADQTYFKRMYAVIITMIIVLSFIATGVWIYATFFYDKNVVVEGCFKGLVEQSNAPKQAGDPPLLVAALSPFKSDDKFFSVKRSVLTTDTPDVDWVLVAPSGETSLLLEFTQRYDIITDTGSVARTEIVAGGSTSKSDSPHHETGLIRRLARIDLQADRALARHLLHFVYNLCPNDHCRKPGSLLLLEGDQFKSVPLVEAENLPPTSNATAPGSKAKEAAAINFFFLGSPAAWAETLTSDTKSSLSPAIVNKLPEYLDSVDPQKQAAARQTLVANGPQSFMIISKILDDLQTTAPADNALLIHNLADIVLTLQAHGSAPPTALSESLARALYNAGDCTLALRFLERLPLSVYSDQSLTLLKGAAEAKCEMLTEALASFGEYLKHVNDPQRRSLALGNMAAIYIEQKRYDEAQRAVKDALTLNPKNTAALFNLGSLELAQGANGAAAATYRSLLQKNPRHLNAKIQLAVALQRQNELGAAASLLEEVLQQAPNDSSVLNNLAYIHALQGSRLQEALSLIDRALVVKPNEASFLDTKGWILYELNRNQESVVWLKKALEQAPDDKIIKQHLEVASKSAAGASRKAS